VEVDARHFQPRANSGKLIKLVAPSRQTSVEISNLGKSAVTLRNRSDALESSQRSVCELLAASKCFDARALKGFFKGIYHGRK